MSNVCVNGTDHRIIYRFMWFNAIDAKINYAFFVIILGRGGSAGGKFRISLGMPVGAVINCADNTGQSIIVLCEFVLRVSIAQAELTWNASDSFQVVRTCTLSLSMAFVVVWTDCQPPVLVTCSSQPSRRVNQNWGKRYASKHPKMNH